MGLGLMSGFPTLENLESNQGGFAGQGSKGTLLTQPKYGANDRGLNIRSSNKSQSIRENL